MDRSPNPVLGADVRSGDEGTRRGPEAMESFGRALPARLEGDAGAEPVVRKDDGVEAVLPTAVCSRDGPGFTAIERVAAPPAVRRGRPAGQ